MLLPLIMHRHFKVGPCPLVLNSTAKIRFLLSVTLTEACRTQNRHPCRKHSISGGCTAQCCFRNNHKAHINSQFLLMALPASCSWARSCCDWMDVALGYELGLVQLHPSHSGTLGDTEHVLLTNGSTGGQDITEVHIKPLLTSRPLNFHWPEQVNHQDQRQRPRDVQSTYIPKGSAKSWGKADGNIILWQEGMKS